MRLVFLGHQDDANVSNRTAAAINAYKPKDGREMTARCIIAKGHGFGYPQDLVLKSPAAYEKARAIVAEADWLITTGDSQYGRFDALRLELQPSQECRCATQHGGSRYRNASHLFIERDRQEFERWFLSCSLFRLASDYPQACIHTQPPPYISDGFTLDNDGPLRVLHCPSNPSTKGTAELQDALADVEGIDFCIRGGVTNPFVLDQMCWADVYLDQFDPRYGGGLGAAGSEALAHGCVLISNARNLCWGIKRWYTQLPPIWHVHKVGQVRGLLKEFAEHRNLLRVERERALAWAKLYLTPEFVWHHWWKALHFED